MSNMLEERRCTFVSKPVLCCVTEESGLELDVDVTCRVEIDYKISDLTTYVKQFGMPTVVNPEVETKLQGAADSALLTIIAKITMEKISYRALQQSGARIAKELIDRMTNTWKSLYGIEILNISVSEIKASAENEKTLMALGSSPSKPIPPSNLAAVLTQATMAQSQAAGTSKPVVRKPWMCSCGQVSEGRFCPECGSRRPQSPAEGWKCAACGTENKGKFCIECGNPFPAV